MYNSYVQMIGKTVGIRKGLTTGISVVELTEDMSIACLLKCSDGVILATESRVIDSDTKRLISDNADKIIYLPKYHMGITCVGVQEIDYKNWKDVVQKYYLHSTSIDDFVGQLTGMINRLAYIRQNTQFLLAASDCNSKAKLFYTNTGDSTLHIPKDTITIQGESFYIMPFLQRAFDRANFCLVKDAAEYIKNEMNKAIELSCCIEKQFGLYSSIGGKVKILVLPDNDEPYFYGIE